MHLISVRGLNFQGYPEFDVGLPEGPLCIVGANMSGKTTFARAVMWALVGMFPYPGLTRFNRDLVRPGNDPEAAASAAGAAGAAGRGRQVKKDVYTMVEVTLSAPRRDFSLAASGGGDGGGGVGEGSGQDVYVVTRYRNPAGKEFLSFKSADGSYNFSGDVAQAALLGLAKIPATGSTLDRCKMLMRIMWFGVGQGTSFFAAQGSERKQIIESCNPFTLLPKLKDEADLRGKIKRSDLEELRASVAEQVGGLKAKRGELSRRLSAYVTTDPGEDALRLASEVLELPAFKDLSDQKTLEASAAAAYLKLAELSLAETSGERLESLKKTYLDLSSEYEEKGGDGLLATIDKEAAEILDVMKEPKAQLAALSDLRTAQQKAAAAVSRASQRSKDALREKAGVSSLIKTMSSRLVFARGLLASADMAGFYVKEIASGGTESGSLTTEDAAQKMAVLDSVLTQFFGIFPASPKAAAADLELKIAGIAALSADTAASVHERRADELVASAGLIKTKLARLATLESRAAAAAAEAEAASGRQDSCRVEHGRLEAIRARAETLVASAMGLVSSVGETAKKIETSKKTTKNKGGAKNHLAAAADAGDHNVGADVASDVASDVGANVASDVGDSDSGGTVAEALSLAVAAFESLLTEHKIDVGAVDEGGDAGALARHYAGMLREVKAAEKKLATAASSLSAEDLRLSDARGRLAIVRSDMKKEDAKLSLWEKNLALIESADQGGGSSECPDCGSPLSREHLAKHVSLQRLKLAEIKVSEDSAAGEVEAIGGQTELLAAGLKTAEKNLEELKKSADSLSRGAGRFLAETATVGSTPSLKILQLLRITAAKAAEGRGQEGATAAKRAEASQALETAGRLVGEISADLGSTPGKKATVPTVPTVQIIKEATAFFTTLLSRSEAASQKEAKEERARAAAIRSEESTLRRAVEAVLLSSRAYLRSLGGPQAEGGVPPLLSELAEAEKELDKEAGEAAAELSDGERKTADLSRSVAELTTKLVDTLGLSGEVKEGAAGVASTTGVTGAAGVTASGLGDGDSLYESLGLSVAALDAEARLAAGELRRHGEALKSLAARKNSAGATYEETLAAVPAELRHAGAATFAKKRSELERNVREVEEKSELRRVAEEIRRLRDELMTLSDAHGIFEQRLDEMADEISALTVIQGLLTPSGETRTLGIANDVAAVVKMTNEFLNSMELRHSLAIDLRLEKDDDSQPTIEIIFEVDGSASGVILPSESQRKIVGLCTDFAVMKLGQRDGFLIVDEPETGLDETNKKKLTDFLKTMSPQTILITNSASSGFANNLTTDAIRSSVKGGSLKPEDFGLEPATKGKRPHGGEAAAGAAAGVAAGDGDHFGGVGEGGELGTL